MGHSYRSITSENLSSPQGHYSAGFAVPPELQRLPSNVAQDKYYDQIAFRERPDRFGFTGRPGVFDFTESVFRDQDEAAYAAYMELAYQTTGRGTPRKDKSLHYRTYWRTHQMSDHLPMWVELQIDHSDEYLIRKQGQPA